MFTRRPESGLDRFHANGSNPARGSVQFDLRLPHAAQVSVDVFDLAGRKVRALVHGLQSAGDHALRWDGRAMDGGTAAQGIYFVRAETVGYEVARRVRELIDDGWNPQHDADRDADPAPPPQRPPGIRVTPAPDRPPRSAGTSGPL